MSQDVPRLTWLALYFSFQGRISRRTYLWLGMLLMSFGTFALYFAGGAMISAWRGPADPGGPLSAAGLAALCFWMGLVLLLIWGNAALTVKRLHDRGWTGWLGLLALLPLIAFCFGLALVVIWGDGDAALALKLLHDAGWSGWLVLATLVPLVALWITLETACFLGSAGPNRYGAAARRFSAAPGSAQPRIPMFLDSLFILMIVLYFPFILLFRSLVLEPFNIPSVSTAPTLLIGDYFFVSKFAYGYSKYSCSLCSIDFHGRAFESWPERGDLVVFRLPRDPSIDYIKRVVGLPGDQVQMVGGALVLNGQTVTREPAGTFAWPAGPVPPTAAFRETLPGGATYMILQAGDSGPLDTTRTYLVPPGQVFVLGDNRTNSLDSRVPPAQGGVGFVPFENLVGKAEYIWWSTTGGSWFQPGSTALSRVFTAIR
jgi:signal peptidase I